MTGEELRPTDDCVRCGAQLGITASALGLLVVEGQMRVAMECRPGCPAPLPPGLDPFVARFDQRRCPECRMLGAHKLDCSRRRLAGQHLGAKAQRPDLSEAQIDGRACIRCGAENGPMVPAGYLESVQVFECERTCRGALPPGVVPSC